VSEVPYIPSANAQQYH